MIKSYYIKNEEGKILLADKDLQTLKNTIMFMPVYEKYEILQSNSEIILFNNEFVFKSDVESEYLQELKDNKIKELKSYCQEVIYDKYSREKQMDIALQVNSTTADKNEMKKFIQENIDKCSALEEKIKTLNEEEVKSFDVKKEWGTNEETTIEEK